MIQDKTLYAQAIRLRRHNYSYGQIYRELNIPKSTLSGWFSHLTWSKSISNDLNKAQLLRNSVRLRAMNKKRMLLRDERHIAFKKQAYIDYLKLKKGKLFIAGLCLYWGEGEKTNKSRVGVINSDASLLRIIVSFYKRFLDVTNEKIRAAIFIYSDIDEHVAKTYWSNALNIPIKNFIKTQVLPSRSVLTKKNTKYGVCSVYFSSTEMNVKMIEWLRLLAADTIS